MRLLLDEMHAPAVAEALVASGHDVVAVAIEPELRGCSDRGLLEYACADDQAIVTENVAAVREQPEHAMVILRGD